MNIILGEPYELIIQKLIKRGYAGSQTEVIRQALLAYDRVISEEEVFLVNKAVDSEIAKYRAGKVKGKTLDEIKKKYRLAP